MQLSTFFFITGVCSVTNSDRKIRLYRVERLEIMRVKRVNPVRGRQVRAVLYTVEREGAVSTGTQSNLRVRLHTRCHSVKRSGQVTLHQGVCRLAYNAV
jgi:hypothetical protein